MQGARGGPASGYQMYECPTLSAVPLPSRMTKKILPRISEHC